MSGLNANLQNTFFGVKVSKTGIPVNQANDNQLIYKFDYNAGQEIFYDSNGNPAIIAGLQDNGSYGITLNGANLTTTNATIVLDNEDANAATGFIEVINNGVPQILIGILPDGTAGMAISKSGVDVFSAFS